MKKVLHVLALVLFLCGPAAAQVDPDPDGVGIYVDMGGTVNSLDVVVGTVVTLHILATNVTAVDGIELWGLSVRSSTPDVIPLEFSFPYASNPFCSGGGLGYLEMMRHVGSTPLAKASIVHLADVDLFVMGTETADLFLGSTDCLSPGVAPFYVTPGLGDNERDLTPSSGSIDLPVFRINGLAPVASTTASWGNIKGLYR